MTAVAPETEKTPADYREEKAKALGLYLWRMGLSLGAVTRLEYSSRDRRARTMCAFAREAYRAAGKDLNPPSSPGSRTWKLVADKLATSARREAEGLPVPARDLTDRAAYWLGHEPGESVTGDTGPDRGEVAATAPTSPSGTTPALEVEPPPDPDGPPPPPDPRDVAVEPVAAAIPAPAPVPERPPVPVDQWPPGWADLAELPPLDYGECVHHPDRRPVVITPDGGRCPDCPPIPREFPTTWELWSEPDRRGNRQLLDSGPSVRDGWGCSKPSRHPNGPRSLNWAPLTHQPGVKRCGCGRCPAPDAPPAPAEPDSEEHRADENPDSR